MEQTTELILNRDILELNKQELKIYGENKAKELIDSGWADPIRLTISAKKYLEVLTAFNKAIKEAATEELSKYNGKTKVGSTNIVLSSSGATLNYSQDPIWTELSTKLKERTELLKMAKKMQEPIYDNEGIEVPKVEVKTQGIETIKVTL